MVGACASFNPQYSEQPIIYTATSKRPAHTFYIADGFDKNDGEYLNLLKSQLKTANEESTLIFAGDNISEDEDNLEKDKNIVDRQLVMIQDFKGKTIFIPGNNEWKSYNTQKIERVEEYSDKKNIENTKFYPKNVYPIEHKVINDDLDLITINSKMVYSELVTFRGHQQEMFRYSHSSKVRRGA